MSLAIFGLLLLVTAVLLGWKKTRSAAAVIVGVLLGVVIAGSNGAMAHAAHGTVDAIRSGLDSIGAWILS
ncbi:hypothetical protein Athai_50830 [Actinocatenispora thailandica]|jgi:hypothetical protein|uniref:Uncharacterized protein n=1 Tax=Actinocatenispora thailandica TaxID=227318 RepID=A0A7R7DTV1_9ACTN|nr:hypothetical protein [Actinocatenispora thailandica]BCJ37580.1 hypothetical protein Athai_50830 [Actinocatenispora thailandica]